MDELSPKGGFIYYDSRSDFVRHTQKFYFVSDKYSLLVFLSPLKTLQLMAEYQMGTDSSQWGRQSQHEQSSAFSLTKSRSNYIAHTLIMPFVNSGDIIDWQWQPNVCYEMGQENIQWKSIDWGYRTYLHQYDWLHVFGRARVSGGKNVILPNIIQKNIIFKIC